MSELLRALGALIEEPSEATPAIAGAVGIPVPTRAEHATLTLFTLYPQASAYVGADGMVGGEAAARVAGFWRALGLAVPHEPDHLAALLGLAAVLDGHARRALLDEHVLAWLPAWLARAVEVAPAPYVAWARLLGEALAACGPPVDVLPVALREAPPPFTVSASDDAETLVRRLLVPAATGVILVRDDLRRAADDLALGLRHGERRYALRALLGQAPAPVFGWLAAECDRQAALHDADELAAAAVRRLWAGRARATATALGDAARLVEAIR